MKLYRCTLAIVMLGTAAMVAGCHSNGSGGDNAASADTAVADSTPAPVTDTDTADETAPSAPPAPQAEAEGTPPGPNQVFVQGSWRFRGGHYLWGKGHWEARRPGIELVQPRWVEVAGKWERHPARWGKVVVAVPMHPGEHH